MRIIAFCNFLGHCGIALRMLLWCNRGLSTPNYVSTALSRSCLIFQCTVRLQENPDIFVRKNSLSQRPNTTNALLWSLHGVPLQSYGIPVVIIYALNTFSGFFTSPTMHELCFHGVGTQLTVYLGQNDHKHCTISMQTPWTTTGFEDLPLCSPAEITESSYCLEGNGLNAQIWLLNGDFTVLLLECHVTAFVLSMLKLRAVVLRRSMQFHRIYLPCAA